jgi:hypothetical protein
MEKDKVLHVRTLCRCAVFHNLLPKLHALQGTYQGLQYVISLMNLDKGCYRSIMGVSVMSHFTVAAGMQQMEIISVMTRRGTLVQFQANQDCYPKRKFRTVQLSL